MAGRLGPRRGAQRSPPPILPGLSGSAMDVRVLNEPQLLFGDLQRTVDPRVGLGLYGPFDINDPARRAAIRLGVVGTGEAVELLHQFVDRSRGRIAPVRRVIWKGQVKRVPMDPVAYPFFPGLDEAFGTEVVLEQGLIQTLGGREIAELEKIEFFEPRVTRLVEMVLDRLKVLEEKAARPDVVIIALSDHLRQLCTRPTRHRRRGPRKDSMVTAVKRAIADDKQSGQSSLFSVEDTYGVSEEELSEEDDKEHAVFHDGLKARAMHLGIPTQLLWEGSLRGINVQDDATLAWNFWTAMYYKCGNIPWRAHTVSRGTCFVGVAFFRDKARRSYRSAMAQAFSDHGEGIVLRGEPFEWNDLRSPHLTHELAADLMRQVLAEYERHLSQRPARVVIHKWSQFWEEEKGGFDEALREVPHVDYVAMGSRGIRFFRTGEHPPLRGTVVTLESGNALLYTRGFIPFFGAHIGPRVPRPIEIREHIGGTSLTQICTELLTLTKLDWNTIDFGGKEPITTAFSKDVGTILAELPTGAVPRTLYRFYM